MNVNSTLRDSKMAVNVGSSSIKTSLFLQNNRVDININFIGLATQTVKVKYHNLRGLKDETYHVTVQDNLAQAAATVIYKARQVMAQIQWPEPTVIGHRVKFSGFGPPVEEFTKKNEDILEFNDYLSSRHNSLCLEVLRKAKEFFPHALQLMVRDQAVNNLSLHREDSIPFEKSIIRRYGIYAHGYHGLAIKACLRQVMDHYDVTHFNGIISQVGSGVSFSTVVGGNVVYNSMQYAACDGPIMHNRSGTQPVGLALRFLKYGLNPSSLSNVYNRLSGIYGVADLSANSTITVENILSQEAFAAAKNTYLKANAVELFKAISEYPDASAFIFSGGLATKHRWLGPELLYRAKVITTEIRNTLTEKLSEPHAFFAREQGISVYLVDIDEQTCIINECTAFKHEQSDIDLSAGTCEVPGTSVGVVHEGLSGWGEGKICLNLATSEFPFDDKTLPEAFIFCGADRDVFFHRVTFARNFDIPALFIDQQSVNSTALIGKKIYMDTPTKTVIHL